MRHLPSAIRRRGALFGFLLILIALGAAPHGGAAQDGRTVVWDRFDVAIEVREDGSFRVTERMEVAFGGSPPFTFGFAEIPLDRVEGITNVAVNTAVGSGADIELTPSDLVETAALSREPGTFKAVDTGAAMSIEYGFAPITDATLTVELSYDAVGALRVYRDEDPANEQVWWTAIDTETTAVGPVRQASVTIRLPEPVDPGAVVLGEDTPGPTNARTEDGQTWSWEASDLGDGDDLVARMQFPPITTATAPAWQARDDQKREDEAEEERRQTMLGVAVLGLGGFGLTGGGIWLFRAWHTGGRDPHVGLVAEFLTEPPDDRPPGLAGALVDEAAQTRELVATMLDLARRGFFVIDQTGPKEFDLVAGEIGPVNGLLPYEQLLLDALFPILTPGTVTGLDAVRVRLTAAAGAIKTELYEELVRRGDMVESAAAVRQRWTVAGGGLLAGAAAAGFLVRSIIGWPGIALAVILALAGVALILTAKAMPRRTPQGAEAAAKWRAFDRHLRAIERFGDDSPLVRDPELFDRYLPFATVFGGDKRWVETFARAGAPAPRWYDPPKGTVVWGRPGQPFGDSDRSDDANRRGSGDGGFDPPSMPSPQGMSDGTMRSLTAVNVGLFSFLNSAATAFTPPSSKSGSGGGFSGGGGSGGGGGGGGRGFG